MKFGTFSDLLALPVMILKGYGQIAHQTLPNILLSKASLVTKSCIARFVEDDAFNLSALSDCSTGPSSPLAYAKSTLSSFQANDGCLRPGLFGRFRSISQQTAHRSRKIRAQCEIPTDPRSFTALRLESPGGRTNPLSPLAKMQTANTGEG